MEVKLLDRVRGAIRTRHYSRRTEEAYAYWIRRYIVFHKKKHPSAMGAPEVTAFLTWLAVDQRVSASTQNQALSAVLFLYREVLETDLGRIDGVPRARASDHVPVVLSREEVRQILAQVSGTRWLIVSLLYGAGLRLLECLELRVKDLDFDGNQVIVRGGKGRKDRRTVLPAAVKAPLTSHLAEVKRQHERDLAHGVGAVVLPYALDRKYPNAATDWAWQFVFPASRVCRDARWDRHRDITCTSRRCSVPWRWPRDRLESRSASVAIRSGIRLPRICSKTGTTFAQSKSSLAMPMSAQR